MKFSFFLILLFAIAIPAFPIDIDASKYLDEKLPDYGFQKAIDECYLSGGGTVKIPEGVFKLRRGLVLRSKVSIEGKATEKTVLIYGREIKKINIVKSPEGNRIYLESIPEKMSTGSAIVICRSFPPSWYGEPRPAFVKEIDRDNKVITIEAPYGTGDIKPGKSCVIFGDSAMLDKDITKGDTQIYLKNADIFNQGEEITIGEPPNESLPYHGFIKEKKGNILILESPLSINFKAFPSSEEIGNKKINMLVWAVFPLIHGANVENITIKNLSIKGNMTEDVYTTQTRYTLAGIHIYNGKNILIENIKISDWPTDGISLQEGSSCIVRNCEITNCAGNGIHPGTGLKNSIFEKNKTIGNGEGFYFCWNNTGHKIINNIIAKNKSHGIGGLGNPGDTNNLIEGNQIYENGGAGIEINGGKKSGNMILNNVIKNNSQSQPGKYPGIMLYASTEDAMNYTIKNNEIFDDQNTKTQYVGIEEKKGTYMNKPTFADNNVIEDNVLSGHKTADIIIAGPNTVCKNNKAEKIILPASSGN